jgi:Cft2 family RNA processing exonuclease
MRNPSTSPSTSILLGIMESNTFETASQETKFAATIKKAWQRACDIYLKESGLKVDSEEWAFIIDTKDPSQLIQVITETRAKHNSSTVTATDSTQYVASSSSAKKTGRFKATFNSVIGRKESGRILVKPSAIQTQHSYVDERSSRIEKLSGKPSKSKAIATTGLEVTTQVQGLVDSEKLKNVVDTVLKFSDGLQRLADISAVVCFHSTYF